MKAKEENFRKIFHHSNDAIFVIDPPNDKILEVNPKACQMLGYSKKELLSMKVSDVHPYEMPKLLDFTKSVAKIGHGWTNELTCLTKNGDSLSAEISASTIDLAGSNCIIAMVRDITERKQMEEALRKTRDGLELKVTERTAELSKTIETLKEQIGERKRVEGALKRLKRQDELILNAAGEGIYGLDSEGRTTFVNPAAAKMIGWDAEELIGKPQHDILHHSKPDGTPYPREDCPIYAAFKDGIVHHVDIEAFWRKDGTSFPVEYTSTPIWEDGKLVGAVVVFKDITERKWAEEALNETLAQLSKKNRYETIIGTVTRSVHQSINLQEVLENAVESMSKNIDKVQHAAIYLVESNEAVMKAHRGYLDWFVRRVGRIPYPKGLTWKTIIEGKTRYCADVDQDNSIGPAGREAGIKSYVSMPITCEAKTVGALNVSSLQKNTFSEEEVNLLEIVTQQIGIAINNAKQAEALRKALEEVEQLKDRLQAENVYLQEEIKTEYDFEEIVGQSEALQKVLRKVEQVAPTNTTVLIQGETGTGKELIARAIHSLSPRKNRPLVKVNCAAISAGLVESELFGHEKGAFTGAIQQRGGRFELADGGTIFLDEVGDLPLDTQVKLLRVLQEGEFERVGSSKSIKVDLRIIAATNRNLVEAVKEGTFRSDLFYRLSVFPMEVPPVRERKSDVPLLVSFFLGKFAKSLGKKIEGVSKDTLGLLVDYSWPGNIRELQNVIERATVLSRDPVLRIDESMILGLDAGPEADLAKPDSKRLEDIERLHIFGVLEETDWVIEGKHGAASILGLNPSTLRSRMRKMGIKKLG